METGKTVNCLIYFTFENQIFIYTGSLPSIVPNVGIISRLKDIFNKYPVLKENQNSLGSILIIFSCY
jgi:hypothetical protein